MITTAEPKSTSPSVDLLLQAWSDRYSANLSSLPPQNITTELQEELKRLVDWEYRWKTAAKLSNQIVSTKCRMASTQVSALCGATPAMANPQKLQRLSELLVPIYLKAAEIYQQPVELPTATEASRYGAKKSSIRMDWGQVPVEQFAIELNPLLTPLQTSHSREHYWESLSIAMLLIDTCHRSILNGLSTAEQLLLSPYLRFVADHITIPWQRLCHSAHLYSSEHCKVTTVKYGISKSQAIAQRAQNRIRHQLAGSPHGLLDRSDFSQSSVRSLEMIQTYFWLSFMHESLLSIEQELVPLVTTMCLTFDGHCESTAMKSETVANEILSILNYEQLALVRPHATRFIRTFALQKPTI